MTTPEDTTDNAPVPPPRTGFLSWTYVAWGAALGSVLAGAGCLLLVFGVLRDDIPPMTAETLHRAEARWGQHGPASYLLDVRVSGPPARHIQVEVRDGEVRRPPTLNGRPIERRHTWPTWTVRGQFEMLHRELELAEDPVGQMNVGPNVQLRLRAEFDPTLGFPRRFERLVIGHAPEVRWEVVQFQPQ